MNTLWSLITVSWMSDLSALMASASSRIASATATVLAPDCFWIPIRTTGTPSSSAMLRTSSYPSDTSATSRTRITPPSRLEITAAPISSTDSN